MLKIISLVLLAESFMVAGLILFKKSINTLESYSLRGVSANVRFLAEVLAKPSVWLGMVYMAIGLLIWIMALACGDLSIVFPIGSLHYLLILFSARIFLGEKLDRMKLTGTLLVTFGIILTAMS